REQLSRDAQLRPTFRCQEIEVYLDQVQRRRASRLRHFLAAADVFRPTLAGGLDLETPRTGDERLHLLEQLGHCRRSVNRGGIVEIEPKVNGVLVQFLDLDGTVV